MRELHRPIRVTCTGARHDFRGYGETRDGLRTLYSEFTSKGDSDPAFCPGANFAQLQADLGQLGTVKAVAA